MKKKPVVSLKDQEVISDPFRDVLSGGARKLIQQAVEVELQELLSQHSGKEIEGGHAAVVRNGYLPEREIQTGIGPVRESTQSWREVLLKLKTRGMNAPKLAVGDGAMGFWAALEESYPDTRQQRSWFHKTGNVLNALPKSLQAKGKEAIHDIWLAETRKNAESAFDLFIETYEAKYPKATLCLQRR